MERDRLTLWVLTGLVGASAVLLSGLLIWKGRPKGRRRCPACWYDMAGTPGLVCPECGRDGRAERRLHRWRLHWRRQGAAAGLLLCAAALAFTAMHGASGWMQRMPRWGLLLLLAVSRDETQGKTIFFQVAGWGGAAAPPASVPGPRPTTPDDLSAWERMLVARYLAGALSEELQNLPEQPRLTQTVSTPVPGSSLFASLRTTQQYPRLELDALAQLGPDARIALPALIEWASQDRIPEARWAAVRAIGSIGRGASAATGLLERLAQSDDPCQCARAAGALAAVAPSPATLRVLEASLAHERAEVRHQTAEFLGSLGAAGAPAIPALVRAIDRVPSLGHIGLLALAQIGDQSLPALGGLCTGGPDHLRQYAVYRLAAINARPERLLPYLEQAAARGERGVCSAAIDGILARRKAALRSLEALAAASRNAVSPLDRCSALDAAASVSPRGRPPVLVLADALDDPHEMVRNLAARRLEHCGARAVAALPALRAAAQDPREFVREAIADAITAIERAQATR